MDTCPKHPGNNPYWCRPCRDTLKCRIEPCTSSGPNFREGYCFDCYGRVIAIRMERAETFAQEFVRDHNAQQGKTLL